MIPSRYWDICFRNYATIVDEETALRLRTEMTDGVVTYLDFLDLFNSRNFFPVEEFTGMWHTTPDTRREAREHNRAMTAEKGTFE